MRLNKKLSYPDNLLDALNQLNKERGVDEPFDCTIDELYGGMASSAIKDRDIDIIRYRYKDKMSFKKMGEALGVSEGVARERHYRSMLRLRREIKSVQNKPTKEVAILAEIKIKVSEREYAELNEFTEKKGYDAPGWLYDRARKHSVFRLYKQFEVASGEDLNWY